MEVNKKKFISGVVEGFYGKPWSKQQRLSLFERLGKLGLNTYVYAPKDDAKHRKNWRDEYMEIEKENLRALISGAESVGINFVYALSPGVDIVFSCPKDVNCLKRKIKQVADLGCTSFALLFDDIEPELSLPDKQDFDSFADAQVFITNQIYEHVGNPAMFLFCPTEYCTTRAKPSVEKSKYLQVLGKSLNENIGILWTGPKVVSKEISTHSIDAVSKVLKRKPVIWDNIHANDYDQRRVFLGPYDGRPADLYEHVSGILTNPNCEYECNFIAVHTLATWINKCEASRMNCDEKKMCIDEEMKLDCDRMDDKKESADELMDFAVDEETVSSTEVCVENATDIEVSGGSKDDLLENSAVRLQNLTSNVEAYCPKSALQTAVLAWLDEFKKIKEIPKTVAGFSSSPIKIAVSDDTNSLVGDTVQGGSKDEGNLGEKGELQSDEKDDIAVESDNEEVQCCPHHSPDKKQNSSPKKKAKRSHIDYSDLLLLADLFFLPYEHGEQAKRLISEFRWLKQHAPPPESANKKNKKTEEWEKRASVYHEHCEAVLDLFVHLSQAPNQQLVQEIYPYIWDVKEVVMILNAFVKWLGSKDKKCKKGSHCVPEDPEPWLFRGGIAEELERLLPIDGKSDMLSRKPPAVIAQEVYAIRPYLDADKVRQCVSSTLEESDFCSRRYLINTKDRLEIQKAGVLNRN
eukprot:gene5325-5994_t